MTSQAWLPTSKAAHRILRPLLLLCLLAAMPSLRSQPCPLSLPPADLKVYRQAIALFDQRQYKQAAQQMRRVAKRNPATAAPQCWLGLIAATDGFNATAIRRYFSRCIALCPDFPSPLAHYYMALIHYTDADYSSAIAELDRYFALINRATTDTTPSATADYPSPRTSLALYEEASNYLYWSRFLADAELHTVPFSPAPILGISSRFDEALPYFTLDGSECYFLRRMPVSPKPTYYGRDLDQTHWVLCRSTRSDSVFSPGKPLPAPFNSGHPEGGVSLTADGSELYFSIINPAGTYANSDLYLVRRTPNGWAAPEPLGSQINSPTSWEAQPSVSPDGQTLYFASNRKGSIGGTDLWRSHRLPNGDWSRPENLGSSINTTANEKAPFLAADGRTLYFLSDGWQGFGGYDIYFANLADPHANRPTNLGLPINTEADEISFGVLPSGTQAYFAGRTDASSSADILLFDLYPAARPEPMHLARIKITTARTTTDTTLLLPIRHPSAIALTAPGTLPHILLCHPRKPLPTTLHLADSLAPLPIALTTDGRLTADSELALNALARWLIAHPLVNLAIECPTLATATAARNQLLAAGLRPERISCHHGTHIPHPQIRSL
ncbi:MAG: PD40 domain-containing protein [Bacteroidales bacterium]|nr:PD40 domain-containing protein [Bacteroidales bacterium]